MWATVLKFGARFVTGRVMMVLLGLLIAALGGLGLQTWRLEHKSQRLGQAEQGLQTCVDVQRKNDAIIERLRKSIDASEAQRRAALEAQSAAVDEIRRLERELQERTNEDVTAIQSDDSVCGNTAMPDDVRLWIDPGRH